MLIIAGHVEVDAADRDRYVALFEDLVRRARSAPGCLDVSITADSVDPARVYTYERWESRGHLDGWRAVANAPDTDISFLAEDVMLYVIDEVRSPFD